MALTKVTSGMVNPDPTNASNLSSGDVPLAQLDNAPETDTSGLRNDISTLALHSAIADNKAAYNLSNSFIDQFEDSTGIDALTTSQRNASEYVVSGTTASHAATVNLFNASPFEDSAVYSATTGTAANCFDGDRASAGSGGASGIVGFPQTFKIDFGSGNAYIINEYGIWSPYDFNGPYFGAHVISGSQNDSSWTSLRSHSGAQTNNASISLYTFTNTTAYRYYRCVVTDNAGGYANEIFLGDWSGYNTNGTDVETPSATGNFTSTTQTALASVSSMGIVVLYKNNSGTASLNTDIVAQVSANGGTNYANATLVAGGTFSTGINIAAVSGVSVTAGTTPKYKISFANQSAGVKETQVHGVALLY
jgi:hypothetical protein